MALSRLYAVRVLTESCGDVSGATAWLREGGACLTQEQQQVCSRLSGLCDGFSTDVPSLGCGTRGMTACCSVTVEGIHRWCSSPC